MKGIKVDKIGSLLNKAHAKAYRQVMGKEELVTLITVIAVDNGDNAGVATKASGMTDDATMIEILEGALKSIREGLMRGGTKEPALTTH